MTPSPDRPFVCSRQPHDRFLKLVAFASLLILFGAGLASGQEQSKRVLLFHSEANLIPANVAFDEGITGTMSRALGSRVSYFNEFLDTLSFSGTEYEIRFKDYLRQKYAQQKLDLIIATGPSALAFLARYRTEVFGQTPVVFCAIGLPLLRTLPRAPNTTGVGMVFDAKGTIELALQLQPGTKRVVVVSGASPVDGMVLAGARESIAGLANRVNVTYLAGLSLAEVQKELSALPPDTIVLFSSIFQDGTGTAMAPEDALEVVSASSSVPVYGFINLMVGRGIVGGKVTNAQSHGAKAASFGLRILAGESADQIPVVNLEADQVIVDWRQMKRWNLSESRLPPGTVVSFKELTIWELYKWRIAGVALLCVLEAVLIGALLVQRRKRQVASQSLAESEERCRSIINNTAAVIYLKDDAGRYILVNTQFEKLFGLTNAEIVGQTDYNLFPPELGDTLRANDEQVLKLNRPLEFEETVKQDGRLRTYVSVKVPIFFKARNARVVCGISTDITPRKESEEALRASQALSKSVLASVSGLLLILDSEGKIIDRNDGWREHEFENPIADLQVGQNYLEFWQQSNDGLKAAGDRIVPGVLSILSGEQDSFSLDYAHANGSVERSFEISVQRLHRPTGGAVISHSDITNRKLAELELQRHREEFAHFSRVAAMGELTASLAHELNQPLAAILSNAQAAQRFLQSNEPNLEELGNILADVIADDRRAGEVIRRLRTLLRRGKVEMTPQNLNLLILEVNKLLHSDAIIKGIQISLALERDLPPVRGDRVQLQQVILNLVINALDATSTVARDARRVVLRTFKVDETRVQVDVEDSGVGIAPDQLERIFDAFYTTKPDGMGMGLSISRSIVELHGGRLWASNNPRQGATLHFRLTTNMETE